MWCKSVGFVCRLAPLLILRRIAKRLCRKLSVVCLSTRMLKFSTVALRLQVTSGSFAMAGQSKHFRSANVQNFNRSTNVDLSTSPPLLQNCLLCLRCSSRPVVSQRWKSHTLCQVLACALAGATWQCVWL